jgi:CheY-like chemotaxis protein
MAARLLTILVIDDDHAVREVIAAHLRSEKHTVLTARSGEQALELIARHRVDLVVVDLVMPGRDGVQVITNLRITHPDIRIIAMSGDTNSSVYLRAAESLGANARLQKPFTHEQLLQAVDEAMGA